MTHLLPLAILAAILATGQTARPTPSLILIHSDRPTLHR